MRQRVIMLALVSAVLVIPLGLGLASREQYEWVGKGGRSSYPTLGSAVLPRAALGAFSLPYVVVALMAHAGARATGLVTQMVAWVEGSATVLMLLLPSAYGIMLIVWVLLEAASAKPLSMVVGLAQLGLVAAIVWIQRRLVRDGERLHAAWGESSPTAIRQADVANVFMAAYIAAWIVSLIVPNRMARTRLETAKAASASTIAAERAGIPVGAPLVLAWQVNATEGGRISRQYSGEVVTVGPDSVVYATVGERTLAITPGGRVSWSNSTVRGASGVVPGRGGVVYVGGADGALYALRASDGSVVWRIPLPVGTDTSVGIFTAALASDGSVYAGRSTASGPGALYRLAPDGHIMWRFELSHPLSSRIHLDRGDTAVFTEAGWLHAVDPDGRALWRRTIAGWPPYVMRFPDGSIGGSDGFHLSVYSSTGTLIGQQRGEHGVVTVDDTTVLLASGGRVALATRTHTRMGAILDTIVSSAGLPLEGDIRPAIPDTFPRWIERWRYNAVRVADAERMLSPGALMPGGRVAISTGARIVVLRLADGRPVAEYVAREIPQVSDRGSFPLSFSPPAVGADGTVYAVGNDHAVYAFRDTVTRQP